MKDMGRRVIEKETRARLFFFFFGRGGGGAVCSFTNGFTLPTG